MDEEEDPPKRWERQKRQKRQKIEKEPVLDIHQPPPGVTPAKRGGLGVRRGAEHSRAEAEPSRAEAEPSRADETGQGAGRNQEAPDTVRSSTIFGWN